MMKQMTMILVLLATAGFSIQTNADAVSSLRGASDISQDSDAPAAKHYNKDGVPIARDYVQQPPLIPHKIDNYRINLKSNKCLSCHSWSNYREAGATMDNICKELPNHIGVELSFMHFLCGREASTYMNDELNAQDDVDSDIYSPTDVYRAYQIRFLNEHLTRWFPQLNEEIQKKSRHVFYRSISNMAQTFLEQDLANLKQQLLDSLQ